MGTKTQNANLPKQQVLAKARSQDRTKRYAKPKLSANKNKKNYVLIKQI